MSEQKKGSKQAGDETKRERSPISERGRQITPGLTQIPKPAGATVVNKAEILAATARLKRPPQKPVWPKYRKDEPHKTIPPYQTISTFDKRKDLGLRERAGVSASRSLPSAPSKSDKPALSKPEGKSIMTGETESIHSWVSLPTRGPMGEVRYQGFFKKPMDTKKFKKFVESIDREYDGWRMLLLGVGQGGTFGYGGKFASETGFTVEAEQARTSEAQTKHLTRYGRNVQFIGTSDCVTCLGVYFEIRGNCVFCAHINAWHSDIRDVDNLVEGSDVYKEMKQAAFDRMKEHSRTHGWRADDVFTDTLRLVCPKPENCAFAISRGIQQFLGIPYEREIDTHAHGFIIHPNRVTERGNDYGMSLDVVGTEWRDDGRKWVQMDMMPKDIEVLEYVDDEGNLVEESWTYTFGKGWCPAGPRGRFA